MYRKTLPAAQLLARRNLSMPSFSLKPDFSKYKLIKQPVGHIVGTVNDATPRVESDHFHGSYHWTYERSLAVALVPLTMAPFISGVDMPLVDSLLATSILMHSHIGFQSCIIDYIPKRVYGVWHTFAMRLLTFGTIVSFYGVYVMETSDEGLSNLIKKCWEYVEPPIEYDPNKYYL
jgi:succinate dehydrogenase hydrophobic anchor subunit